MHYWLNTSTSNKYEYFLVKSIHSQTQIPFGRLDCHSYRRLCREFSVTSLPTLQIFQAKRQQGVTYNGMHRGIEMIRYIKKMLAPALQHLQDVQDVFAFKDSTALGSSISVIGFFSGTKEDEEYLEYLDVAKSLQTKVLYINTGTLSLQIMTIFIA
jgi:hypothetical protein